MDREEVSGVRQSRRFSDISDEKEEEEEIGRGDGWKRSAIRKFLGSSVETDKDKDEEDKDDPKESSKPLPGYPVGCHVAAIYDRNWFVATLRPRNQKMSVRDSPCCITRRGGDPTSLCGVRRLTS